MTKYNIKSTLFILIVGIVSSTSSARNIEITIEGQGQILAQEANYNCTSNCTINNNLQTNTLIATPNNGWGFSGWEGQQCDSGSQVIIKESYTQISRSPGGAKTLATADLNNDNIDDLVAISLFDGVISIKTNEGNDVFSSHVVDQDLVYPTALDLYDWEGDGDLDLFVAEFGRGVINVYLNDGHGEFLFYDELKVGTVSPYSFVVADKNDDGLVDFIVSSFRADTSGDLYQLVNSIQEPVTEWYIDSGDGFIKEEKISDNAAVTLDAFLTSNGFSIVAAEIVNGEVALYHSGNREVIDVGSGTYGVSVGDIDNDGLVDVLAAHYRPSILNLLYGTGENKFSQPHLITNPEEGLTAATFGDYNNDGYVDLATGEFNNKLFYYFPTTSYRDCIVSSNSDISLTAIFSETTDNSSIQPTEPSENVNTKSNSGGSFSFFLCILGFYVVAIKKRLVINS